MKRIISYHVQCKTSLLSVISVTKIVIKVCYYNFLYYIGIAPANRTNQRENDSERANIDVLNTVESDRI